MLDTQTIHAPELPQGLRWINSPALSLKQLRGNVVLLDFWDYTCVNCVRTLPYVVEWAEKYKAQGLVTIGVHAPEFEFARESRQIEKACAEFGIGYPVVLDNEYAIWQAYDNKGWPSKYLIDGQGYVRYNHFGEGEYLATEMAIQYALRESNPNFKPVPFSVPKRGEDSPGAMCYRPSPELHLGYERSDLGNAEGVEKNVVMLYHDSGVREGKHFYVQGAWRSQEECIELMGSRGYLAFNYKAKEVNVVMSPTGDIVELMLQGQGGVLLGAAPSAPPVVRVLQDGLPLPRENAGADIGFNEQGEAFVIPDRPRMFKLVNNPDFEEHELQLVVEGKGFAAYAVSFTTCVTREPPTPLGVGG
jgi:thiol-disulfide isomerase/thioredoxin